MIEHDILFNYILSHTLLAVLQAEINIMYPGSKFASAANLSYAREGYTSDGGCVDAPKVVMAVPATEVCGRRLRARTNGARWLAAAAIS